MSPSPSLLERLRGSMTWGALEVAIWALASIALGVALSWVTRRVLRRIARKAHAFDDQFVARLRGPLAVGFALAGAHVGLSALDLAPAAEATARRVLQAGFVAALFWVLLRSIDVADHLHLVVPLGHEAPRLEVVHRPRRAGAQDRRRHRPGASRCCPSPATPWAASIAGLGIGGLALALGAQKTLEHVFGAFALAVDQPFREGDFVKIDDVQGTVESVGLRSTRIRTPNRTVVAIPNGKLAEMRTETYAARDRLRLACTISLTYATTREQMGRVVAGLEETLRAQPKLWRDGHVGALHGARGVVARRRRRGLVRHARLARVPGHPPGGPARLHAGRRGRGRRARLPHAHRERRLYFAGMNDETDAVTGSLELEERDLHTAIIDTSWFLRARVAIAGILAFSYGTLAFMGHAPASQMFGPDPLRRGAPLGALRVAGDAGPQAARVARQRRRPARLVSLRRRRSDLPDRGLDDDLRLPLDRRVQRRQDVVPRVSLTGRRERDPQAGLLARDLARVSALLAANVKVKRTRAVGKIVVLWFACILTFLVVWQFLSASR